MLREKGKQLVFVTNNSTKSRADYKKKFDKVGITANVVKNFHPFAPLQVLALLNFRIGRSLRLQL